ncbi:MAG TPA: hypothetical protein VMU82_07525 [Acetobacteraceae bacterium]|nr:hypothetical protein [Acetobacteraceae bacterium]
MTERKDGNAWVKRVLGIDVPGSDASSTEALARSVERGREAAALNVRGIAFPKLLLRWRAAQDKLTVSLNTLAQDLLGRKEVLEDPRFQRVKAAAARLPQLVPRFGGALEDLLDAGINAGQGPQAADIAARAVKAVDDYRTQIAAASQLAALEAFAKQEMGTPMPLGSDVDTVLVELRETLAKPA